MDMTTNSIPQLARCSSNSTWKMLKHNQQYPTRSQALQYNFVGYTTNSIPQEVRGSSNSTFRRCSRVTDTIPQEVMHSSNSTFGRCSRDNIFLTSLTYSLCYHADSNFRLYLVLSGAPRGKLLLYNQSSK